MAPKYRFDNMDAATSAFFSRELEAIDPKLYEVQYPELMGRVLVPIKNDIDSGAEDYTYRVFDEVGKAVLIKDYTTGLPRIDVSGAETSVKLRGFGDSYGWSIQEARAAMMARRPLDAMKARAARKAIERKLDDCLLLGDTESGATGLFGLTGTDTYTTPAGASGLKTWADKTSDEILADLDGVVIQMLANTKNIEVPDTMVLPLDSYGLIKSRRVGDGDSRTILKKFLDDSQEIKSIFTHHALATLGAGTTRRGVCYKRDPDRVTGLISQEFEQFPPQTEGLGVVVNCHARCGGTIARLPKSVSYFDRI